MRGPIELRLDRMRWAVYTVRSVETDEAIEGTRRLGMQSFFPEPLLSSFGVVCQVRRYAPKLKLSYGFVLRISSIKCNLNPFSGCSDKLSNRVGWICHLRILKKSIVRIVSS
jgi:hypothetical protein